MAIRLRNINGRWIALCAARSIEKDGDIYLHDGLHGALSNKFSLDFNSENDYGIPYDEIDAQLIDIEESNNPNRKAWDTWIETGIHPHDDPAPL